MEKVALEILKYPDKCKLNHVDDIGNTALILACNNYMNKAALEIFKYPDKCNLYHINKYGDTALTLAIGKDQA